MRLRLILVGVTVVLVALCVTAAASAQAPELEFVSPDQIALTGSDDASDEVSVWVKNASDEQVTPAFAVSLEDGDGHAIAPDTLQVVAVDDDGNEITVPAIAANAVGRYRLLVKGAGADQEASGELIATSAGVAPASVSISLGPKPVTGSGVDAALLFPLGAAVLLIVVAWVAVVRPIALTEPLGTLDLGFSASFASTLTAVGALLGTIIAAGVLPEDTVNLSKDAFTALNLLFGVAIIVSGVVYAALQRAVWVDSETVPLQQERKLQGYVGPFLISCLITVWAVFGELWVTWLLIDELGQGDGFTGLAVTVFRILLLVGAVAMIFYTLRRIQSIVKSKQTKPGATAAFGPPAPTPLKRISLL
ncbi:MAG: hypothetical protein QOI10_188 [Solirubrobacterales bacterium]|jgi:hypothetical protein|nr:hypothetical protein [Solirubrobacterales bacterium]